jgi:hypothetical protein
MYKNVRRFPGGHQMLWRPGKSVRPTQYWVPSAQRLHRSDQDLIEEFGSLLMKVTRAASRSANIVCCEVSGGIDSSSIATVLGSLATASQLLCPSVEAHSIVYPGLACDESTYIQQVGETLPFALHTSAARPPKLNDLDDAVKRLRYPYRAMQLWGRDQDLVESGSNVILTGYGGDELFSPTEIAFRQAFTNPRALGSAVGQTAQAWRRATHARSIYGRAYLTFAQLGGWRLQRYGHRRAMRNGQRPAEINEHWFRAIDWSNRVSPSRVPHYARVASCAMAISGYLGGTMEWIAMHGAVYGLDYRHPLCSATLIEFANRLPTHLLDGFAPFTRWPMRLALGDRLPEAIATRRDKADYTEVALQSLWALWDERLSIDEEESAESSGAAGWRYFLNRKAQYSWPPLAMLSVHQWVEQGLTSHPMGLPSLEVLR